MKQKCNQCEYEWLIRVEDPVSCPRCKRNDWKEENKRQKKIKEKPKEKSEIKNQNKNKKEESEIKVSFDSIKKMTVGEVKELTEKLKLLKRDN